MKVLQVFGVRVRDGSFSNRVPGVRADTVAAAWCAVAEVHLMEGRHDPRNPLSTFSSTYFPLHSPVLWRTCHPPSEIVSCVISALRKHAFEVDISSVRKRPGSTGTGWTSAPKCRSTTHLRTQKSPLWKSFKCLESGFVLKLFMKVW